MIKKFFQQLNVAVLCGLSALIFFVLGFVWWVFDATTLVPMWVLSLVVILCYLICVIVYGLCSLKKDTTVYRLPAVRSINKIKDNYVFIVERNDLFNHGYYATICYQDDDDSLETVIGLGYVQSVNSAGNLQIVFERLSNSDAATKIYKKIDNTKAFRKAIKIKPSIHKELFEEASTNG